MPPVLRWALFAVTALVWMAVVAANGTIVVRWCLTRKPQPSAFPIVGTLAGAAAVLVMPIGGLGDRIPWLPLALLADLHLVLGYSWWLCRRLKTRFSRPKRRGKEMP